MPVKYLSGFCLLLIVFPDILLIIDLYLSIIVVFLTQNTTFLISLIDQKVIVAFKSYLRRTFAQTVAAAKEDTDAVQKGLHL